MWIILALAMVEYFAISIFIPIDPYASKGNKRLKRFIRMVLWLLTDFIVYYQIKKWDELVVYLMISTFFTVKYFLEIFNPYLGDMYLLGVFSGGMSYYLCSVVKRVDTFLNTIFRKDRITPGFPCRTPLFHLVYNHQAKSEGV